MGDMDIKRRALLTIVAMLGSALTYKYLYPLRYFFLAPRDVERVVSVRTKQNVFTHSNRSLVSVVEVGDVKEAVENAVKLIGGFKKLRLKGKEVLVKPNVNSDDPHPATTNPEVVRATVELLYEAGARRVVVGDMSGIYWLPTKQSMEKTGIAKAVLQAGAELAFFEEEEWVAMAPPQANYLKSFSIPRRVYEAEVLISLPVIKTHKYATYSMSLKNFVGIISSVDRRKLHTSRYMEEMIAEINLAATPDLIIMDGTRSMVAGGPTSGSVKETNVILASGDRVAIDVVGLSIVKSFNEWERVAEIGIWEQRQIKRAVELGLGANSCEDIEVVSAGDSQAFMRLVEFIKRAITE
jgi:uncharacterized protein (DUF362 family)